MQAENPSEHCSNSLTPLFAASYIHSTYSVVIKNSSAILEGLNQMFKMNIFFNKPVHELNKDNQ